MPPPHVPFNPSSTHCILSPAPTSCNHNHHTAHHPLPTENRKLKTDCLSPPPQLLFRVFRVFRGSIPPSRHLCYLPLPPTPYLTRFSVFFRVLPWQKNLRPHTRLRFHATSSAIGLHPSPPTTDHRQLTTFRVFRTSNPSSHLHPHSCDSWLKTRPAINSAIFRVLPRRKNSLPTLPVRFHFTLTENGSPSAPTDN